MSLEKIAQMVYDKCQIFLRENEKFHKIINLYYLSHKLENNYLYK